MNPPTILLADDDDAVCMVVTHALESEGYRVRRTADFAELMRWVETGEGDAVISDVVMPSGDGLQMLPHIKAMRPELPVIIISAQNTLMTAVKSTEGGAFDYLPKPFDLDVLCATVAHALQRESVVSAEDASMREMRHDNMELVGHSPAMQDVFRSLARLVSHDLTVMIEGESGTGKELVARAIHHLSARKHRPFVAVNMGAIPKDLVESELFGHEKGAFTGAISRHAGMFERAAGGTLFLDEIGDMPTESQTKLLRVLQQGECVPVGGSQPVRVDVRIICATHRNVSEMVAQGQFREDLYYRLNVVPLAVPPLRARGADVVILAQHFLAQAVAKGLPPKQLDSAAASALLEHDWPGNVRELENLIYRVVAMTPEPVISADAIRREWPHKSAIALTKRMEGAARPTDGLQQQITLHLQRYFAAHGHSLPPDGLYERMLAMLEKPLLEETLRATGGNQLRAAKLLGINRNTLRKKMQSLGMSGHRVMPFAATPLRSIS